MFGALSGRIDLLVIGVLIIVQFNIVTGKYSKIISHLLFDSSQFGTQIKVFLTLFLGALTVWSLASSFLRSSMVSQVSVMVSHLVCFLTVPLHLEAKSKSFQCSFCVR
jgi:hypothetical protein